MTTGDDNYSLIIASKNGDYESLSKLIEMYSSTVHSVIYSIVGNKVVTEDLAQETFLRMISGLENYEFRAPFKSWLLRIAVNQCRDHLRRKKVRRIIQPFVHDNETEDPAVLIDPSPEPADDVHKKERIHHLHQAISKLPEELRTVLVLRDIQEFSYDEIAETLKWRIGTVKSRLFRARQEIYKKLSPIWEEIK